MATMLVPATSRLGTAIRTISDELQGLDRQAWVTTAYMITSTISTPIYGKLSDVYGRRRLLSIAIGLWLITMIVAGMALWIKRRKPRAGD